jgi:putative methionine-R-sulfoxide reductase with GAF domain
MQGESELVVAVFVEDDEQMFVLDLDAREARWRRVGNSARP